LFSGTAVLLDDENSAREVMRRARSMAGDAEIGLVAWKEQNLLQAQGPVVEFGFRRPVDAQLRAGIACCASVRSRGACSCWMKRWTPASCAIARGA
jgi:hypothetical protein